MTGRTDSAQRREEKAARIRHLLSTEGESVERNTQGFNRGRYDAVADLSDYEELKDQARAVKEDAIARLPELIEEVRESVESRGGHVYLADDADDANRYIREVVEDEDADSVVKSKSMTSEEIEVNDALREAGAEVWETDLGEFVLQVADEAPSHIVAPAIHKSEDDIAELFNAHFDPEEPLETADDLTRFAREYLAERIAEADVGMTGANFVAADTGTLALVTSEGNARKTVAATDTHVAVAGVEKLLPRFEDVAPFVELIGRSGTGQAITSYVTFLTPPGDAPTLDWDADATGPADDREFHLVLLDNGRMAMRDDDQLRETLYCIRCSACLNSCANFQHVGGHAFGGETYSGGIATGWEAGVHGLDSAGEFNDFCTGCTRCVNQCPVKIDIPWINTVVRDRLNRGEGPAGGDGSSFDFLVDGLTPDEETDSSGLGLQKRVFGNFPTLARLGSATAPVSNWVARAPGARALAERVLGVDSRRDLPEFRRESLRDWFTARGGPAVGDADREVVVYPDPYTNYVEVERGKAAVRTLEELGVEVRIPDLPATGRAPLSQGMISTAESQAETVADALGPMLDAGRDVVVIEPSDLAMLRADYRKLLPDETASRIADRSYELFEYLYGLLENGADADGLRAGDGEELAYHAHCQQRTLGLEEYTTEVLGELGYEVRTSDAECCGMAGSFGYKREYYELSMDVGADLRNQFADAERAVASGTSCCEQLSALRDETVPHPIRYIAPDE
ncbi:LUD domain-containing protein [Halorussus lipolyticus]|uniref:LUD domain-containing protein n=1 Tax=Halorussus lipolyticus TaxID=3034024 RepID=UPI0023E88C6B|nr:LUD domain-containing protein [Halorussus sp. DT80]